jgi:hypothetical protein
VLQADATDVGAAIGLARENGLEMAAQRTPQGDGFRVMNGGLVIVLRDSPKIASDIKAANKGG